MAETSLINFDSFENTLKSDLKVELKRRTKYAIMSLYKDGPQLVDLSNPLFVSTMSTSEFTDVSEFDPFRSKNEMSLSSTVDTSINKTDCPNGFPRSNHKNVATRKPRTESTENTRRDTEDPNLIENTNTRERKETPINQVRKIAFRKRRKIL